MFLSFLFLALESQNYRKMKENKAKTEYINEVIESIDELSADKEIVKTLIHKLYNQKECVESDQFNAEFILELLKIYDKK